MNAAGRNFREAGFLQPLGIGKRCRTAGTIQPRYRAIGLADQGEAIAADAGHVGFGDTENGRGRDRRVDGIATGAQHVDSRQCGKRRRGGGHAIGGHGWRPAGLVKISHGLPSSIFAVDTSQAASHHDGGYSKKPY